MPTEVIRVSTWRVTMNGDYAETKAYLEGSGSSMDRFGRETMRHFMDMDNNPELGAIDIKILRVVSGSIIVDTEITAAESLLAARRSCDSASCCCSHLSVTVPPFVVMMLFIAFIFQLDPQ